MSSSTKVCCISECTNTSREKRGFSTAVKFYKFLDSMFGMTWKIAKRQQWIVQY